MVLVDVGSLCGVDTRLSPPRSKPQVSHFLLSPKVSLEVLHILSDILISFYKFLSDYLTEHAAPMCGSVQTKCISLHAFQ